MRRVPALRCAENAYRLRLLALEPRILFDGAVTAETAALKQVADAAAKPQADAAQAGGPALVPDAQKATATPEPPATPSAAASRAIVAIDTRIADYRSLLAGVAAEAQVVLLDGRTDGAAALAQALADAGQVGSIQIYTHGADGFFTLGATRVTAEAMHGPLGEALRGWSAHLAPGADILVFGCSVAATTDGRAMIAELSRATGADVAASADLTGAAALGANWTLEVASGPIEASPAISAAALAAYATVLEDAAPTVSVSAPGAVRLGESFDFTLSFDNTAITQPGYAPYIDLFVRKTGSDGAGAALDDGITFNSASYLGAPVAATTLTFTDVDPGAGVLLQVTHPFARDASGNLLIVTAPAGFQEGDQLVVLALPFGSFSVGQPAADVVVSATMSNLADLGTPLAIAARGGFRFGSDPLDNPAADPTLLQASLATAAVSPTLFSMATAYNGPEGETATGPSYPRSYTISVAPAAGQTLTAFTLTQALPSGVVVTGINAPGSSSVSAAGGLLTVNYPSLAAPTAVIVNFYVDDILPVNGASQVIAIPQANGSGTWAPIDVRDPASPATASAAPTAFAAKSLATQKSIAIVSDTGAAGLTPGDVIEYTIDFQVSDFYALGAALVTDLLSDGQTFLGTFAPTVTLQRNGTSTGPIALSNFTVSTPTVGTPATTFTADLGAQFGSLVGDRFNGAAADGPTQGTIRFRAIVRDDYLATSAVLKENDGIANTVTATATALEADLATPVGAVSDASGASANVPRGAFRLDVYSINADRPDLNQTPTAIGFMRPGDVVTYRLQYDLATGDWENFRLGAYLPLPVFRVGDPDANGAAGPAWSADGDGALPETGEYLAILRRAGADGLYNTADDVITPLAPTVSSVDTTSNALEFDFGNRSDPANQAARLELFYSATTSTDPFADGLTLTQLGTQQDQNSPGITSAQQGIAPITLQTPLLAITKGIVATDNAAADTFTPATVGPAGVTWAAPGAGAPFAGTISSGGLALNPVDSDVAGVDAGDFVRYAIVIENTGSSANGAFDVTLRDLLPANLEALAGSLNLRVTRGDGAVLAFTDAGGGALVGDAAQIAALFGSGIRLVDGTGVGALLRGKDDAGATVNDGRNIAVISFDARIRTSAEARSAQSSDATLANYAGAEGAANYVPAGIADPASVTVASATAAKTITGTSQAHTAGNNVVVGEIVSYRVTITVPEGQSGTARLVDTLDAGLAFVVGSPTISFGAGVSATLPGTPVFSNGGRTASFDFGVVTNANSDDATPDTITITYQAVVLNAAANQAGGLRNNTAGWTSAATPAGTVAASAPDVTIREPNVTVAVTPSTAQADAGDTVSFTVDVTNPNAANAQSAFEVSLADAIPAGFTYVPGSLQFVSGVAPDGGSLTDAGGTVRAAWATLAVGQTSRLSFQVTLDADVSLAQQISNVASIQWSTLPGTANTDLAGDGITFTTADAERTGNTADAGGAANDYRASDTDTVQVLFTPVALSAVTSEAATAGTSVAVGEIVRYRAVLRLPESQTNNLQFTARLPGGLQFLDDGTAALALVSDSAVMTSSTLTGAGLTVTGNETNVAGIVPTFVLPAGAIADSADAGAAFASGEDVAFSLGNIVNADNDANQEFIVVEFNAIVLNEAGNQSAAALPADLQVFANGSASAATTSNTVTESVVEPVIANLDKQVITTDGTTATFRITLSNSGNATAFDTHVLDVLPANLANLRNVTLSPAGGTAGVTNASTAAGLDVLVASIPVGGSITITYQADVVNAALPVASTNATVTYTSLSGSGTTLAGSSQGAVGGTTGERTGTGGINDYNDADPAGLSVLSGSLWEDIAPNGGSFDQVRNANEVSLANVSVNLRWAGPDGIFGNGDDVALTTVTDANGNYAFGAIPAGNVRISLDTLDPDFAGYTPSFDTDGAGNTFALTQVAVGEGVTLANRNFTALGPNDAPAFIGLDAAPGYTENDPPFVIDANAALADAELDSVNNWSGATLVVARAGGANAQDVFGASGSLSLAGGNVVLGGTTIGTYANAGGQLAITFNNNATAARVDSVLQQITYANASEAPPASVQLAFNVNDGNAAEPNGRQGTGGPRTASGNVTIAITPVNDAPQLADAGAATVTIAEDAGAPSGLVGSLVSSLLAAGSGITDPDGAGALQGIAIVAADQGNGRWWYSTDDGATWTLAGTPSAASALLLAPSARVYFEPNANFNGPVAAGLTFRAWDQSTGTNGGSADLTGPGATGGTSAFSTATDAVGVTVTPVNDAPVAAGTATLPAVSEDAGSAAPGAAISALVTAANYTDATDTVAGGSTGTPLAGIAITANAATAAQGTWQYDAGAGWVDIPIAGLSTSAALVLPAGAQLRFVANADWNGTPGALTAHLSDGTGFVAGASVDISGATGGTNGWSAAPITIATSVTAVNDAPTRADAVPAVLAAIAEDTANPPGDTVANLFGPKFVDAADQIVGGSSANTLAGIAITANAADPATQGRWQYTIDGGTTWTDVGVVSAAGALLLPDSASLRFVPVADFNGTPGALSVRLVDSSGGAVAGASTVDVSGANSGGITRYAGAADAISLGTSVGAVNDAPLASAQATTILEDGFRQFAAADFAAAFSDVDGDALAAIRIDALPARGALTLGGVAVAQRQVIAVADIVNLRYTPAADENGAPYASFDFSVSDGAAFSAAPAAYTINVTPVNDAPALSADLAFPTLTEDVVPAGRTLAQLVASTGATLSDVDAGASLAGFAITGNTALPAQGRWQYSSDGADWFDIGAVADGSALVLAPATQVRFVPAADFSGTPGSLALRVLDDTYAGGFASTAGGIETRAAIDATVNGGTTAIAAIPRALATTVAPVTDPPNLTANPVSGNEDTTIPLGIAASLNDTDGSETLSITIAGIPGGSRLSNAAGDTLVPAAGTIILTPAQLAGLAVRPPLNFNGVITLDVTATSVDVPAAPVSITAPLVLTVIQNNDPPVATDDAITTAEDTPTVIPVLANDSDVEDGVPAITAVNGIPPVGGIITAITANGGTITVNVATGEMRYTPAANWNGVDTFAYTVTDTDGVSDTATVTVNVTAVNDAPNPAPDVAATIEDTAVLIDLLANDTDIEGDALALSAIDGQPIAVGQSVAVAHGTVTLNANGTVTFTPAPDYSGPATFRYTATDRNGGFAESVANISVAPVTDVPALGVAPASGVLGTPVPLPIQAGSTDSDGSETVTVTLVGLPDGSVLVNGAGETFVVSGGAVSLPSTALPGLAVSLPPTFSGVATVQVTATARDGSAAPVSRTAAFELRAEPPRPSEPASPFARGADPYLLYPGIELDAIILRRGFVPAEHVLNAVAESRFERARLAGDILDTVDAADVGAVRATLLGGGYLADQPRTVAGAIAEARTDLRETRVRAAGAANPLTRGAATLADDFDAFAPAPIGRALSGAHGDRPAPGEVRKEAAESATTPVRDAGRPQASSAATAPARAAQAFSEQLHQAAAERTARQLPPPAVAERRPR